MLAVWRYHSHISWDSRSGIYRIPVCVLRDLWWESHPSAPTILDTIIINIEKKKKKKKTPNGKRQNIIIEAQLNTTLILMMGNDRDMIMSGWCWTLSSRSSQATATMIGRDGMIFLIISFFMFFLWWFLLFLFTFFVFVSRIRAVCEPFNLVNGHLNWRLYFFVANM